MDDFYFMEELNKANLSLEEMKFMLGIRENFKEDNRGESIYLVNNYARDEKEPLSLIVNGHDAKADILRFATGNNSEDIVYPVPNVHISTLSADKYYVKIYPIDNFLN